MKMQLVTAAVLIAGLGAATCRRDDATGPMADTFVLRDNGIRCITFPCFNIDAVPARGGGSTRRVSDIDFGRLDLSQAARDSLLDRIQRGDGVTAQGRIERVGKAGPAGDGFVFRVSRLVGP